MSFNIDKLQEEHDVLFREHKVVRVDSGHICQDCNLNAWDEDFPEYCIGPTTEIQLGNLDTNEESYSVSARLFHLHRKALIEFSTSSAVSDNITFDIDLEDLNDMISILGKIESQI